MVGFVLILAGIIAFFVFLLRRLSHRREEPLYHDAVEAEEPEPHPEEVGEGEMDTETYKAMQEPTTPTRNM